jgi:hypothetical protein
MILLGPPRLQALGVDGGARPWHGPPSAPAHEAFHRAPTAPRWAHRPGRIGEVGRDAKGALIHPMKVVDANEVIAIRVEETIAYALTETGLWRFSGASRTRVGKAGRIAPVVEGELLQHIGRSRGAGPARTRRLLKRAETQQVCLASRWRVTATVTTAGQNPFSAPEPGKGVAAVG